MLTSVLSLAAVLAAGDGGAPPTSQPAPRPSLLVPPPPARSPPTADYRLNRAKDGSGDLLYDAAGFGARIARDGSVRFSDKHSVLNLIPFLPGPPPAGVPTLEGTIRSLGRKGPKAPPTPPTDPSLRDPRLPADAITPYRPDAREACQYPRSCFLEAAVVLVGITGRMDITDEVMRLNRQDPYRYEKARFLSATGDLRARMAGRAHAEDLQRGAADLPGRLRVIACDDRLTVAERRAVLEALRAELDSAIDRGQLDALIRGVLQTLEPDAGSACPAPAPPPAVKSRR